MTQPAEAVGGEAAPVEPTNPADVFTKLAAEEFGLTDEEEQDEAPAESDEGEEPQAAEEADDDLDDEAEADDLPPIDAPVSWDAEAKAKFAELPRELQETVAKRETERERFVQQKSQEATRAQRDAEQAAIAQLAQIQQGYAQQYQQLASSFDVAEPDPMLLATDPVGYAQQMRAVQHANAQRTQAQQLAQQHAQQAQHLAQQAEQAEHAEQARIITEQFPEYADPTTGPELRQKLSSVAKELGYPDELIGQARATDILAMRTAAEWKAKASKYDALQAKKMEKVRAAKGLPKQVKPGVSQTTDQSRARNVASLTDALNSKNRDVQGQAFFELGKAQGWLS